MGYGGTLPVTGGIAFGSIVLDQTTVAATVLGMVLTGALLIKLSFRRGKAATAR
jgi:hypothetical protein